MNRRLRTLWVTALAGLLVVALAACAGLPVTGPVNPGRPVTDDDDGTDVSYVPAGPADGATPVQIVEGFIAAGSGPSGNWEVAQEFLTDAAREVWKPQAGVTIYESGTRTITGADEEAAGIDDMTVTIDPVALVDSTGSYAVAGGGALPFAFQVEQIGDEWRIAQAPDGILIDENRFESVFSDYEVMYFDRTWSRLVPDVRWFPPSNAVVGIAEALVDGVPSPWLTDAVVTAFSPSVGLAVRSVPERAGVAEVSLAASARGLEQQVLDRMQTQLEESLRSAGVLGVEMLVDDQILPAEAVPVDRLMVDNRPLVLTEDDFGYLSGAQVEAIVGLSDILVGMDATAIEVSADRRTAAVRLADGRVIRVGGDGAVTDVDARPGLAGPTIDTYDYVWTVPIDAPAAVIASAPDGSIVDVAGAWPGATEIAAMRVSRDGTRIAAVVRDGDRHALWVAGIVREDEVPIALGDVELLAQLPGPGVDVAWLGGRTLVVAGSVDDQGYVLQTPVGGPVTRLRAPLGVTTVSGGNQPGVVRLRSADGELFVQRGVSWQNQASGIRVLATQQGSPR